MVKQQLRWKSRLAIPQNISLPEKLLADFKIRNEDWNIFQLSDGSTLKIKYVLINVFEKRSGEGFDASLQSQNVMGVFSPDHLRGKPSESYTKEELANSIAQDDVDVEKVIQQPWNEYEINNDFLLKVKTMPVHISRTAKYDREGIPIYLVQSTALLKTKSLKKTEVPKKKK
jgi:hypothetical protein